MSTPELRKAWRAYCDKREKLYAEHEAECERIRAAWLKQPSVRPWPVYPPRPDLSFPEIFIDMTCGAKTRKGTPCKRKDLYRNGRCRLHGGLSTGPVTDEGKKKAAQNGFKRKPARTP